MRAIPAPLLAHLAQPATTLATLIRVTRRDNQVFGFTDHDRDILFGGVTYSAQTALAPSQIESRSDLAVDNLEAVGSFSGAAVTAADLEAGVWDGAAVRVSQINWADPSQGEYVQRVGDLGQVRTEGGGFVAELRGLMDRLQKSITETYLPSCAADLGDSRCGVALGPFTVTATVTAVTDNATFAASSLAQPADHFRAGVLTWTGGANAGRQLEVKSHAAGGALTLLLAMPSVVAVGDTFSLVAGCDKLLATCSAKFGNVVNFRGFPDLPGPDKLLRVGGV